MTLQALHHSSDDDPGITRQRCGKGFTYRTPEGETIRDPKQRERLDALAIPPAWEHVWICNSPRGHLQATGRDASHRKQYRYHPEWRAYREQKKFDRLLCFGENLPRLRQAIDQDLRSSKLSAKRVTAAALRVIDLSGIRVGNEHYRREHQTYGLTTIRERHIDWGKSKITMQYKGKSGKQRHLSLDAPRVARVLSRCHELPGQSLWTYESNGQTYRLTSDRINEYIQTYIGEQASAKTFRIWIASTTVLAHLAQQATEDSQRKRKSQFLQSVDVARAQLGNTRTVCRNSYLHPAIERYHMADQLKKIVRYKTCRQSDWLTREEAAMKRLLHHENQQFNTEESSIN